MGRVLAALSLSLVIAACGSGQKEDIDLQGQLTTANDDALPDDASARISLVQQQGNDSKRSIVAERTLHDLGDLPIKFDLTIGRGLLHKDAQYGLRAEIRDAKGDVNWQTPVAQAVQPFAKDRQAALLMLQDKKSRATDNASALIRYACDDQFQFTASDDGEHAKVRLGHRQLSLKAKQSQGQSAIRYVDDHGNSLLIDKDNSELTVDGTTHANCQVVPGKDNTQSAPSDDNNSAAPADEGNKNDADKTPSATDSQTSSETSEQA